MARRLPPQYDMHTLSSIGYGNSIPNMNGSNLNWHSQDSTSLAPGYSRPPLLTTFSCQAPRNPESRTLMSFSSAANGVSGLARMDSPGESDLDSDRTSPSTTYSTSFPAAGFTLDPMAMSFNSLAVHDNCMNDSNWWDEIVHGSSDTTSLAFSFDGLPSQNFTSLPSMTSALNDWSVPDGTVSPHALTLDPPSISMITSGAVSTYGSSGSSLKTHRSSRATPKVSYNVVPEVKESRTALPSRQPRHKLSTKPITNEHISTLQSSNRGVVKSERKLSQATRSGSHQSNSSRDGNYENISMTRTMRTTATTRPLVAKLEPKSTTVVEASSNNSTTKKVTTSVHHEDKSSKPPPRPSSEQSEQHILQRREEMDKFLVQSKLDGMSYKEIRRKGGFSEAESTLRGRFRTLTKKKDERVRKPEWDENDVRYYMITTVNYTNRYSQIRLLKKAVRKLSQGTDPAKMKTPWKLVADYIFEHGGSYHFGNATCRKRWDQLQGRSNR
jgi:hypothetical protein